MIARRALALLAGGLLLAGCGSGSGSSSTDTAASAGDDATAATQAGGVTTTSATTQPSDTLSIKSIDPSTFMRGSSVGFGEGPAPSFAPAVAKAAKAAGCRLRSDPSAVGIHLLISDIQPLHVPNPDYSKVPRPPTNGHHRPLWADWGFYKNPVPYAYEVHNLEHGGIVIHLGLGISTAAGTKVVRLWADSPPFMLVVPGRPADVPPAGATITSWQRAMICKKWNPRVLGAIISYRDVYRGTGPEQVPSLNTGTSAKDLPTPALPDPSA
ncbi:MAG TPA: DUF3105 domain-containing protein [Gaiellales bacterium]